MEKNEENLSILRHSTSHIMAQAVKNLFPEAKLASIFGVFLPHVTIL